ncbi:putative E3 ubiquitin-protein ligase makorin-1 isoform X2 [Macrotis lagotis]|uniref:putative E3 ubiquitin-protein ligase makorin-1 isoform X2 n=1 Tax=Macrotis lagotis TaxID=92651 RepID=UPI003D68D781
MLPRTQTPDLKEESQDVVCGICMEKVWDKPPSDRFFAILPNCSHAYCVNCLRTWRRSRGDCPQNITNQILCKFFIQGRGWCPFKSDCIYQHQFPESWPKNWDSVLTPREPSDNSDDEDEEEICFFDHTIRMSISIKKMTYSVSSDSDDSCENYKMGCVQ